MISRRILNDLGLTKEEYIDTLMYIMPDFKLVDLQYLLMNIEMEITFREDHDLLDDEDTGNE